MKSALLAGTALLLALPAYAAQNPVPSRKDPRVGYFTYAQDDVFRIWSTPGARFLIKFGDGETFDAATAADACEQGAKNHDNCGIEVLPRGNFVYLSFWRCLIPSPLLIGMKTADGKLRMYNFEVHTEPKICGGKEEEPAAKSKGWQAVSTAEAAEPIDAVGLGNLKYIGTNALTATAKTPIFYSAAFAYPEDEVAKRKESAREKREREKKERDDFVMNRELELNNSRPRHGIDNINYRARGARELEPAWAWDTTQGTTKMVFLGMQEAPVLYRVDEPEGYQCRDDEPAPEGERLAQYAPQHDTLVITGTAKVWRLRGSQGRVLDVCNLSYTPFGSTTGTGTPSPYVQRVVKGSHK